MLIAFAWVFGFNRKLNELHKSDKEEWRTSYNQEKLPVTTDKTDELLLNKV